jgi:shikimate kinase
MQNKIIFLIGFMGSGKTTIGRKLAAHLRYDFVDTDQLIVEEIGMPISEYIIKKGETKFREKERFILSKVKKLTEVVVSTGGGMPCFYDNMDQINQLGLSFYLSTGIETIYQRISNDPSRPLGVGKSKKQLKELLTSRSNFYNRANYKIVSNRKVDLVVSSIVNKVKKAYF